MFKSRKRIHSAWMRGLMFGRALGAKQERERNIDLITGLLHVHCNCFECDAYNIAIRVIEGKND